MPNMQRNQLRLGALGAIGTLLFVGWCHYVFFLFLAAGDLEQDISYLSVIFIVLTLPHLAIGFANGYFASTRNAGIILTLTASFLGVMVGIIASAFVFVLLEQSGSSLWNREGRPIAQNIGWYSLTLGIVGVMVGIITILIFTSLRDLLKSQSARAKGRSSVL